MSVCVSQVRGFIGGIQNSFVRVQKKKVWCRGRYLNIYLFCEHANQLKSDWYEKQIHLYVELNLWCPLTSRTTVNTHTTLKWRAEEVEKPTYVSCMRLLSIIRTTCHEYLSRNQDLYPGHTKFMETCTLICYDSCTNRCDVKWF